MTKLLSSLLPTAGINALYVIYKNSNHTALPGQRVLVGTDTGAITITLPVNPTEGMAVGVWDADNNAGTNNVTIGRNGQTIDGVAADDTLDVSGGHFEYVFDGTTWKRSFWAPGGLQTSDVVGAQTLVLRPYDFTQVSGETTRSDVVVSGNNLDCLDMVATSGYHWASIAMPMPKSWDGGTIRFRYAWVSSNTDTGDVQIGFYNGMSLADGDDWNVSGWDSGNGVAVSDTGLGAANRFHLSAWSAWTNMNAIDDGLNIFRVQRNAAIDTYTGTAKFLYLEMQYKTDALNDD